MIISRINYIQRLKELNDHSYYPRGVLYFELEDGDHNIKNAVCIMHESHDKGTCFIYVPSNNKRFIIDRPFFHVEQRIINYIFDGGLEC